MLLTVLIYLILLGVLAWTVFPTVREHELTEHKSALSKCLSIWFISSLPIFFGLALTVEGRVDSDFLFSELSGSPFSWSEQLVYASTYLAPVIYAVAEALKVLSSDQSSAKKRRFKRIFKKYWRVFFPALALLFLSIAVFAAIKVNPSSFKETFFYDKMEGKSIYIYVISWIYWYCIVLIEGSDSEGFAETSLQRTQSVTEEARARLGAE